MSGAPLPSSFDDNKDFYEENRWQKLSRRLKEEPLIPFGCALTCWALYGATRSIRAGDHVTTNRMFRARILAQGFTLLCLVAGSYYYAEDREKRKVFEGTKAEQKAKERNARWIRELEARDLEERKEIEARTKRLERRNASSRADKGVDKAVGRPVEVAKSVLERSEERWNGGVLQAVKELVRK